MKIYSVLDKEFAPYGKVLEGYDTTCLLSELDAETPQAAYLDEQLIKDHFGAYFRHYDHDYKDLKRLLGVEPLVVTILPIGSLKRFEERYGYSIRKINPSMRDVIDLNHMLHETAWTGGGRV